MNTVDAGEFAADVSRLAIQESRTQGEERTDETQHVVRLLQESLTLTTDD
jgi:hypothetical protein